MILLLKPVKLELAETCTTMDAVVQLIKACVQIRRYTRIALTLCFKSTQTRLFFSDLTRIKFDKFNVGIHFLL